ncbi:MAG: hypothetical protein ACTS3R_16975 [Inquilinaceae bacterium]
MGLINEAARSVMGAWRLACRDPGGMAYFDRTPDGAARSFVVALWLLPPLALMRVAAMPAAWETASPSLILTAETLSYVIGWVAFPVAMITITRLIDRAERYVDFLVAYNWSAVIQVALFMPLTVVDLAAPESVGLLALLGLIVYPAVLYYAWYVLKTALDVGGGLAIGLLLADLVLSIGIDRLVDGLLYGG